MRILIDGANLVPEGDQALAVHARNLSFAISRAGHEVAALYGKRIRPHRDPLLREILFFDAPPEEEEDGPPFHREALDWLRSLAPHRATEAPLSDHVLKGPIRDELPEVSACFNVRALYAMEDARAATIGGLIPVTLPRPVEIAHWTRPAAVRARGALNVYTVHDLAPVRLPYASAARKAAAWRTLRRLARNADHFVTGTEAVRDEMVATLGLSPDAIAVIAPSLRVSEGEGEAQLRIDLAAFGGEALTPGGYFLHLGGIEPRRNLARVIEGHLAAGASRPLVVAGAPGWRAQPDLDLIARSPGVRWLGAVSEREAAALARGARAVVSAALGEEFPMAALMAFRCGAALIGGRSRSLTEVAGDAALEVDALDPRQIREAIRLLDQDDARAAELAAMGAARADLFSEDRAAEKLDALYRRLTRG